MPESPVILTTERALHRNIVQLVRVHTTPYIFVESYIVCCNQMVYQLVQFTQGCWTEFAGYT